MKKLNFLLLLLFAVGLISCGNDDGSSNVDMNDLLGSWNNISYSMNGSSSQVFTDGPTIVTQQNGTGINSTQVITFAENPMNFTTKGNLTLVVENKIIGFDSRIDTFRNFSVVNDGTWELEGNELTLNDNLGSTASTIKTLTADRLVISARIEESQATPFGLTEIDQVIEMTFVR